MSYEDAFKHIPLEGFVKLTKSEVTVTGKDRSALIRKGNELFNAGAIEKAKRVFITAQYGDGLSRLGDHYLDQENHLEALRMYWLAPSPDKVAKLIEKITSVVQEWVSEEATE